MANQPLSGLNDQALITAFRTETHHELSKCTQAANPVIWQRIQNRDGYKQVEQMIIDHCLHNGITPSAAIGLLESELSDH